MDIKKMLIELSDARGISGRESGASEVAVGYLKDIGKCETDALGNLICTVSEGKEMYPHLVIDAHLDEIGFVVRYIEDDGMVRLANVGGIDKRILPGAKLRILGREEVLGVVSVLAPHLSEKKEFSHVQEVDELYLNTGFSREELKKRISLGDSVVFDSRAISLGEKLLCGKSMDNRVSCAVAIYAASLIREMKPENIGVSLLLSSREEVGGQGARAAGYGIPASHAIVLDVTFGTQPGVKQEESGKMGEGPMIGYSAALNYEMGEELKTLAEELEIPHQIEVMGGSTGTNAEQIAVGRDGVKTALLSVPIRYMHTPNEVVDLEDIKQAVELISKYVSRMEGR